MPGYQPGSILTDRYWNYVATPLLFAVIGFGGYVLFNAEDIQLVSRDAIMEETRLVKAAPLEPKTPRPVSVAAPVAVHRVGP